MSQLKTRISLKHDTEENWLKATNFVPKAGEMIIYDADSTHSAPRLKVGDGKNYVNDLPFANAFKNDLTITKTIGAFSGTTASPYTIPYSAGKTAEELLMEAFGVVTDVTIVSRPNVKNNVSNYIVEIGEIDPIRYDVSFVQGKYSNGERSVVTFGTTEITATMGEDETIASLVDIETPSVSDSGTLGNQEPITDTVTVLIESSYGDETRTDLKDFSGKDIPAEKLIKGDSVQETYTVTPKRGCFYGFTTEKLNLDEDNAYMSIRGLKMADDTTSSIVNWGRWTTTIPTSINTQGSWLNFYIAISVDEYTHNELTIVDDKNIAVSCEYLGEFQVADAREASDCTNTFKLFASTNLIAYDPVTLTLSWK